MRIDRLKLKNFRCYDELDIDFDPKLTLIVGGNGKGKTAIFDALAIALEPYLRSFGVVGRSILPKDVRREPVYGEDGRHIERMERRYPVEVRLEGDALGRAMSSVRAMDSDGTLREEADDLLETGADLRKAVADREQALLPVFAYYGTSRIWVDSSLMTHYDKSLEERGVGYEECLEPSSSYNTFGKWFEHVSRLAAAERQDGKERLRNLRILRSIQYAVVACLACTCFRDVFFIYKLIAFVVSHPDVGEMIVDDLSDGFRSVLSMVSDLAYRMVRLNPHLGEQAVLETSGLVLLDEIEMHLHPLWQQTVLLDMQRAFPNVQFVVTTHSPQVLGSVPAESVRVLMWGKQFEGVRRVSFSMGATSAQILQDIQNVAPRSEHLPIVQSLKRYLDLVSEDKWDSPEALALREQLDAWSNGQEPALLRADMDIRMRQFRRKRS